MSEPRILGLYCAKPCPFCGSQPKSQPWHGGGMRKRMVCCVDEACFASPEVTGSTTERALENWNVRYTEPGRVGPKEKP